MASTTPVPFDPPKTRPLAVYAFDPTHGHSLGNYMTIEVPYEKLQPGPIGKYLAVIDYDAGNDCYYDPVDLDAAEVLIAGGLDPSEADPRFHQQMVYAVASETIRRFEFALGRRIRWGFDGDDPDERFERKLRIYPHAMQDANAYYSRDMRAIVFGYFKASETDAGASLPGQTVFTCLSHDIIVHEVAHALVDGQRKFFMEPSGPDTLAFHEAFADIVALLQHFSFEDALLETIERTGGMIFRQTIDPEIAPGAVGATIASELTTDNPMVQLARQFGEAMGLRSALRSAIGTPPNTKLLDQVFEPHDRGAILVAAVFDAFFTSYVQRTRPLMRIAHAGGASVAPGNIHPELARELAQIANKTAVHFSNICIRALDYCPPVDITFGDFLRALVTADFDAAPEDRFGYRAALIDAFRSRGICPQGVNSYSEESLRWCRPEELTGRALPRCEGLDFNPIKSRDPSQREAIAKALHAYATEHAEALGLDRSLPIWAKSFHLVGRVQPDGRIQFQVAAELLQQRKNTPIDPTMKGESFTFRGGSTVIFDEDGDPIYAIEKPIGPDDESNERLASQRAYYSRRAAQLAATTFVDGVMLDGNGKNFAITHRGY